MSCWMFKLKVDDVFERWCKLSPKFPLAVGASQLAGPLVDVFPWFSFVWFNNVQVLVRCAHDGAMDARRF